MRELGNEGISELVNGEQVMGNGERGTGNGEQGTGNGVSTILLIKEK